MPSPADVVMRGARIRTMDPARPLASAVAFRRGTIVAVGDEADVADHVGLSTQVLELDGATMVPGLTDSHSHVVQGALWTLGADLTQCRSIEDVRAVLASAPREAGWVRGWGLQHTVFGGAPMTFDPFEDVLQGAPAAVLFYDCHSILASRRALELAGITGHRELAFGSIACDSAGRPTGHLIEAEAMAPVQQALPEPTDVQRNDAVRDVVRRMAAVGLTGAHLMDDLPGTVESLRAIDDEPGLKFQVYRWLRPEDDDDRIRELIAENGTGGRRWRFAGVKIWLDGTVEGGTSWLLGGDHLGQNTAGLWSDQARYGHAVRMLARAGVATATHAIGDGAVGHVLDTFAQVPPDQRAGHRVEHIETITPGDLQRFAQVGIGASMQPTHCTRNVRVDRSDDWSRRVGNQRYELGWPVADLRTRGVPVALGSDWPVAHYDPREGMADAQLRHPWEASDETPRQPNQAVSALQALEGYTTQSAQVEGRGRLGQIVVGEPADLTAFAGDPLMLSPYELGTVDVRLTVVGGEVVHQR